MPSSSRLCNHLAVSRFVAKTSIGLAYSAWKLWRRLPPEQRRLLLEQARRHGPRVAKAALKTRVR